MPMLLQGIEQRSCPQRRWRPEEPSRGDQLRLERELAALQKRFAMTDDQLTQSKGDLRTARSDLEKLRRDNEVRVSVSLLIFGGSIHGFIAP